jgi:methyltransferase (TIGR00027 family)
MIAAVCRGRHRMADPTPWVFDDPYALSLVGPSWTKIQDALDSAINELALCQMRAGMVGRSRYAEDRLDQQPFSQFVILGAGLDSFAWRRPDILGRLRIFEVDHPATQAWKQERATALALPEAENHVLTSIDFDRETLREGLTHAGFEWSGPAFFSWLGVTQYLTTDAIRSTLQIIASCAPGSEIVFTYVVTPPFLDDVGADFLEAITAVATRSGEPWRTYLSPSEAEALVECEGGLLVSEHLSRDDLHERYFTRRPDNLMPYTVLRYIAATVP